MLQGRLTAQQIARGSIQMKKAALLEQFNLFTGILDSYFVNTEFIGARPLAPTLLAGQAAFTEPMVDMMNLWEEINDGPAPAGVTLPLVLPDGATHSGFASAVSSLQFAYADERKKGMKASVSRSRRDRTQVKASDALKAYREAVPPKLVNFPELIDSLPRFTPLPGHTPDAVNASAIFEAPDKSKVVHDASNEPTLVAYQLRGHAGDDFDPDLAVVIDTHGPNDPREFITPFGLNQPGAQVALKVFVMLSTGNEAGSAPMLVQRPLAAAA